VYLQRHRLALDLMGVVQDDGEGVEYTELCERYCEPRTVVLVHWRSQAPVASAERLRMAERWLG
jgi:hypothetical protein